MNDEHKSKDQLIRELADARKQIAELERNTAWCRQAEENSVTARREAEESLKENEERLSLALSAGRLATWDWRMTTGEIVWNDEHFRMMGYDIGEVKPSFKAWAERVHPEDRPGLEAKFARLLVQGGEYADEFRTVWPDGTVHWIESHGHMELDAAGRAIRSYGIMIDVTESKQIERKLFETNQRLQVLMDALPVGVSLSDDATCRSITGNPTALRQFRVKPGDNLSASALDHRVPGRQARFFHEGREISAAELPLQRAVAENREIPPMELEIKHPSGRRWYMIISGAPIHDKEGHVISGVAVTVDITERKKTEDALRESEDRLRIALEAAEFGTWDMDLTTGIAVRSLRHDQIFGFQELQKEWTIETAERHVLPEDLPLVRKAREHALKTGNMSFEARVRWPDGSIHWISSLGRGYYDSEGRPVRLIGVVADITTRKLTEEKLRESEQIHRMLIHNSGEAILFTSPDGKVYSANPEACRIIGRSEKEICRLGREGVVDLSDPRLPAALEQRKKTGIFRGEQNWIRKDGTVFTVEITSTIFKDYTGNDRCTIIAHDITERKQAEEELARYRYHLEYLVRERTKELEEKNNLLHEEIFQRKQAEEQKKSMERQLVHTQKMEALGRFAGGIAHDLNNLLYPIIVDTEYLLDETVPLTSVHQTLKQVLKAAYRQRDLVKQILSFSRRSEQQLIPTQLIPLLNETLSLLHSTLPSSIKVRQRFNISSDMILCDPTQIQQIVLNLFRNAVDAIGSRPGTIDLSLADTYLEPGGAHPDVKAGQYIKLMVEDTGHGITKEIMDRIFDPFFTTKDAGKGSGMGLAVVHGILKQHGGSISVESDEGKGSRFCVYLPLTDERPLTQTPAIEKNQPIKDKCAVLLVDDEEIILSSIQNVLRRMGFEVIAVNDGKEAHEVFSRGPSAFDLVITDLTMPQISGVELANKLLDIRPDIPIILCTGFNDIIDEEKALSMGIRELLLKPASTNELKTAIIRALENQQGAA